MSDSTNFWFKCMCSHLWQWTVVNAFSFLFPELDFAAYSTYFESKRIFFSLKDISKWASGEKKILILQQTSPASFFPGMTLSLASMVKLESSILISYLVDSNSVFLGFFFSTFKSFSFNFTKIKSILKWFFLE